MQRVYTLCENLSMADTMGERLKKAREKHYSSARKAALRFGWAPSTYAAHENGQNEFGPEEAKKYGKAFKAPWDWILGGEFNADIHVDSENVLVSERPTSGILEIDVRAGMGAGGATEGREVVFQGNQADPVKEEAWHFPARFMREEVRAPENRVIVIETQGDSMAPTITSGDRVVVDTGHTIPSPDGIYAIRDQFGSIVVKRLQTMRQGGKIRIISDNKAHDAEDVGPDEIAIVGRVLWGLKRL